MIKHFLLAISLIFLSFTLLGQTSLSSDFENPTSISQNDECKYSEFTFDHFSGNDLAAPSCSRLYPGASSYFTFNIPETNSSSIRIKFEQEERFCIALYSYQFGEYIEIKYNFFVDNEGTIFITPEDSINGTNVLVRFWKNGEPEFGTVKICISNEPPPSTPKVLAINTTVYTAQELVEQVLITGCLTANNILYTGANSSIGYFSNGIPGLNFTEGVILSTGLITDAPGPNIDEGTSTTQGTAGDMDLENIAGETTSDAAILEFDFVPASNLLEFEYVFGSEEYDEYAPPNISSFNDVFAFFISGGPEGYVNQNIALVPGTTTAVSIFNVNAVTNNTYFIHNEASPNIEYDGLTTTLTATATVTACATYHIKLAIADGGDTAFDSAVFLKANSFTSGESYTVESFNSWSNSLQVMRGCSNFIIFSRTVTTPIDQPVPIILNITGTATMGVDYSDIPLNLEIPAGEDELIFYFDAYDVGVATGDQTIILNFENGCPCDAGTTQHIITIIDPFVIDPTVINDSPICVGDDATLTLTLNAPDLTDVTIEWSTGDVDVDQVVVSPTVTTTYTVDVIFPCDTITLTTDVVVIQPPVVDLGPDQDVAELFTNINAGMAVGNTGIWTYTGGPGVATVLPDNTSTTTATVDQFGVYNFTFTETSLAPNCVDSDDININFYHIPTADFIASQTMCFGDNTTITFTGDVVAGMATFVWDFGNATIISGTGEGPYVVNFPNDGDHIVSLQVSEDVAVVNNAINIFVPPILDGSMSVQDDPCFESCGGRAIVTPTGGTAPYSYSWGSSTNELANLCEGDYGLTLTDINGCTFGTTYSITQPPLLEYDTSFYHVSCYNTLTGGASITAIGGTPPYQYLWNDGHNMSIHNNIHAGIIDVTVIDDNNCQAFELFNITEPSLLTVITSGDYAVCENQPVNIAAQEGGGTYPYIFYWDNGDGSGFNPGPQTFQVIPHADIIYTIYVEDANGCLSELASSEIIVSPEYHLSLTTIDNTCYESCNGSAELGIIGGLQPFQFSWNSSGPLYDDLCAGLYTVSITDQIGCSADTMFVINQPTALQMNLTVLDANCAFLDDGTITAVVSGGTPPYTYRWPDTSESSQFIGAAGTYLLTVSDDNNCRIYGEGTIESPEPLMVQTTDDQVICIGGEAHIIAEVGGGTSPDCNFYWSGSDGTEYFERLFDASPTSTTRYNLTVTDANGCTLGGNYVDVTVHPPLEIEHIINSINDVCLGYGTPIELVINGGNSGPYTITTNEGEIVRSPFTYYPEETTNLVFTVVDQCETPSVSDSITIYVHDKPTVDFTALDIEGCPGQYIRFTSNDSVDNYEYVWNFGDAVFAFVKDPTHQYTQEGLYTVSLIVRDEFGCEDSLTQTEIIDIFPKPTASFSAEPQIASILNPQIKFTNFSEEALFYFWYYGDGDSTINFRHPEHIFNNIGEYEVMLICENEYGCQDTSMRSILIREEYTIYAPTAFSPNGDGINDCFRLCGNGIDKHSFKIIIYNRWGELVYTTEEYDPEYDCKSCGDGAWDGTTGSRVLGDKYLSNGMYYWYATFKDYDGIGHEHQGNIQLIR